MDRCIKLEITPGDWYAYFENLLNKEPCIEPGFNRFVREYVDRHDQDCSDCNVNQPDVLNR